MQLLGNVGQIPLKVVPIEEITGFDEGTVDPAVQQQDKTQVDRLWIDYLV